MSPRNRDRGWLTSGVVHVLTLRGWAGPSVYEAFVEPSRYPNHGQRVTVGRRFIQSSTDIFVGWTRVRGIDFYVRQFRDMKVIPSGEQVTPWLRQFAREVRPGHRTRSCHDR